MNNCYICSTNAIFEVQMLLFLVCRTKKIELSVQTFDTLWHKFCHFLARVLRPYGMSFAALWPSTKINCVVLLKKKVKEKISLSKIV